MGNTFHSVLKRLEDEPHLSDLKSIFSPLTPAEEQELFRYAYGIKSQEVGRVVYFRGIIEFSNICTKDCYYCGIRKSNSKVNRYELTDEEILREARWCDENHYGSLVLQSGERSDAGFVDKIERLLVKIKSLSQGRLGVTLSLGEQSYKTYKRWFDAGAHRYLLRIETSNPALYSRIHPEGHSWENRKHCLQALREAGYQVGTGFLIGVPGQTIEDMAADVLFLKETDADMVGMGPYIPHDQTPLFSETRDFDPVEQLSLGLKMIAAVRIVMKDINIAATTALQALSPAGREMGLRAGANIIMPNVTDLAYRTGYQLYQNKPGIDENAMEQRMNLEKNVRVLGEEVHYDAWGDSPHFQKRLKNHDLPS